MTPGNPFDPFMSGAAEKEKNWDDIFTKPKVRGAFPGKKIQEEKESASDNPELEFSDLENSEDDQPPSTKSKPVLSNPRWGAGQGCLDEKILAKVDGSLPPEISHITRITFTLFAKLPDDSSQRIEVKEAHLHQGVAEVEFTLWTPGYRDQDGKTLGKADYYFLAKHRDSEELKSAVLPASVKRRAKTKPARELKRGVRGEDVLGWQRFLMQLREKPEYSSSLSEIRQDGIFGLETRKATISFQSRVGVKADGIVGPETREQAELLGALFEDVPEPGKTESTPRMVQQGKIPVFPPAPAAPPAQPPPGPRGSTREESWKRLRAEGWKKTDEIKSSLEKADAVVQSVDDGSGDFIFDEYKVEVSRMPTDLGPEELLKDLATALNATAKNEEFDLINFFKRRRKVAPAPGEIVDIDIMGPDNGSVILGEMGKTYFIYQTIDCAETWSHPENGSREFGFEIGDTKITFYTRGVSRPGNFVIGMLGSEPQRRGWTALMKGISNQINSRGGTSDFSSFGMVKERREN